MFRLFILLFMLEKYKILVAQPVSPGKNFEVWSANANKIFNSLTFESKVQGVYSERVSDEGGRFARHARVRNGLLNNFLTNDITHVLWFDSDVVDWDPDIIEKLLSISDSNVVAPYVFIEDNDWWPFKRFYDISCFRDLDGNEFDYKPPFYNLKNGDVTSEVSCVGTVFMVPADLHRKFSYDPYFESNEHIFFFNQVIGSGRKVIATPDIEVKHAFLPKYGEKFH
jgi:hypothetical protein